MAGEDYKVQEVRCLEDADCIYGLGDKTGFLNKRYYEYEMWNSDIPDPQEDNLVSLFIPGENLIMIHIINIEMDTVTGQVIFPQLPGHFTDLPFGLIAPS